MNKKELEVFAKQSAKGVKIEGHKELVGMCIPENEGAKFW
jgi:transposase-like protein